MKGSGGRSESNRTSFLAQGTAKLRPALPQGVVDVEFICVPKKQLDEFKEEMSIEGY